MTEVPVTKPSGSFWTENIPADWTEPNLRYVASIRNGSDYKEFQVEDGGYPVIGSGGVFARTSKYLHDGESVLLGRKGTVDKPLYVNGRFWTVDTMFYTNIDRRVVAKFLHYFATTIPFDYFQTSTAVPSMTQGDLGSIKVPLPELERQQEIVDFLDRETAQIDDLISKQERLIELLDKKRQAIITHAVTKGLDPTALTKPSGIPWLGDIPAHWTASQLGTWLIHKIEGGYSPTASGIFPEEEDWGVLSLGAVGRGEFLPDKVKAVDPSAEVPTTLEIRDGDLLLTRSNVRERVGFAAVVEGARPKTIFPDLVYRLGVNSSMDKQYLAWFLSSTPARAQIESSARGSSGTMPKISHDQIRAWRIPLPPLREQQELVAFVRSECSRIDNVSVSASNAIGLLQERRSALISAAVSGRIDVRERAQS